MSNSVFRRLRWISRKKMAMDKTFDTMNRTRYFFCLFEEALKYPDYSEAKKHLLSLINNESDNSKLDWIKFTDDYKRTAWHWICRTNYRNNFEKNLIYDIAFNLLTVTSNEDFLMRDERGCIPFHYLFKRPSSRLSSSLVRLLLDHCRSRNILQDLMMCKCSRGLNPLQQLALKHKKLSVSLLEHILKDCCDTNSLVLPEVIADRLSNTLLHFAAKLLCDPCDPTNNESNEDNERRLLNLWIKYSPSALIMYNHKGHLPIDDLIEIHVIKFVTKKIYVRLTQQEETITSSNFYYCRREKKTLKIDVERQIYEDLWPKISLFLNAMYRYLIGRRNELSRSGLSPSIKEHDIDTMSSVHLAASCPFLPVIIFMCAKIENPNAIYQPISEQRLLPLHLAASSLSVRKKDEAEISDSRSLILSRWANEDQTYNISSQTSAIGKNCPRLNLCSHSMIQYILELDKGAARSLTKGGQLPLHLACINGQSWKDIRSLLQVAPETISHQDKTSRLYPFMLAAADENNSLDVIYQLLLFNPEIVKK